MVELIYDSLFVTMKELLKVRLNIQHDAEESLQGYQYLVHVLASQDPQPNI